MSDEILLEIKPKFNNLVRVFSNNLIYAAAGVYVIEMFLVLVFITISGTLPETFSLPSEELMVSYIIILSCLIFILLLPLFIWLNKKNYEVTSYKVYKDRIELVNL